MRRHASIRLFLTILLAGLFGASQSTAFINGDLETRDFTGWAEFGDASVDTLSLIAPPVAVPNLLLIITTHSAAETPLSSSAAITAAALSTNVTLPIADLNALSPSVDSRLPVEGSAVYQDINGAIGDQVSFDWAFLTDEATGETSYTDFAFWAIIDNGTGATVMTSMLAQPVDTLAAALPGSIYTNDTQGWQTASYTVTYATSYRVIVGVVDVGDDTFISGAVFDNFVLATPEPGTGVLLGIGLVGLVIARRRRA